MIAGMVRISRDTHQSLLRIHARNGGLGIDIEFGHLGILAGGLVVPVDIPLALHHQDIEVGQDGHFGRLVISRGDDILGEPVGIGYTKRGGF